MCSHSLHGSYWVKGFEVVDTDSHCRSEQLLLHYTLRLLTCDPTREITKVTSSPHSRDPLVIHGRTLQYTDLMKQLVVRRNILTSCMHQIVSNCWGLIAISTSSRPYKTFLFQCYGKSYTISYLEAYTEGQSSRNDHTCNNSNDSHFK